VLGGIGNLRGALLGGLALGLIENYGSALWGTEWKDVIAFLVLVLVLMVRPTGLLGESLGKARV
jgi:branched-chain amino acid transport system permease protein